MKQGEETYNCGLNYSGEANNLCSGMNKIFDYNISSNRRLMMHPCLPYQPIIRSKVTCSVASSWDFPFFVMTTLTKYLLSFNM